MNLDLNNQIARSCDQFGHIGSPKNANFGCVFALYFCPLVLGHPVLNVCIWPLYNGMRDTDNPTKIIG